MQQVGKQFPAEMNAQKNRRAVFSVWSRTATVAMQRRHKHGSSTVERLCSLHNPYRGVVKRTVKIAWVSWASRRKSARIWSWKQRTWTEELRHQNYWVQFSGVRSLVVKRKFYVCYSNVYKVSINPIPHPIPRLISHSHPRTRYNMFLKTCRLGVTKLWRRPLLPDME
jgi:hypothetical protein